MYFKDSVVVGCVVLIIAFTCWMNAQGGEALEKFGFNIHHRYSDTVREYLGIDGLPEKDTVDYFAAMAHRDQLFKARRLADSPSSSSILTFLGSNLTRHLNLGFLHYAVISVGTPPLPFLVALDTGSNLFWLPCDCTTCIRRVNITSDLTVGLNIYSPGNSSTSMLVSCNDTMCGRGRTCSEINGVKFCAYKEESFINTSSTGFLVNDVLHLGTNSIPQDPVDVPITLGCGLRLTGIFLRRTAINGLIGLGMDNISIPSILANKGLTANSFSMCFGNNVGRIEFGDKGSPDQEVTSFNIGSVRSTYDITITQISVGNNKTDLEFTANFDSGSAFTYLVDPAYSVIANSFNSQVTDLPYQRPQNIFDFCYMLSASAESLNAPMLNLTMKGGSQYSVQVPTLIVPREGGFAYCLAIFKSEDISIIGQNFMVGQRIVFDREKMVLGWKVSDCFS